MIEHLQARLRQAMQDSAVEKQAGSEAQLEEQAIMLQQAYDRIQQLEDANSELQVIPLSLAVLPNVYLISSRHTTCRSCAWRHSCLKHARHTRRSSIWRALSCMQSCRSKAKPLPVCMAEAAARWAGCKGAAQGPRPGAGV